MRKMSTRSVIGIQTERGFRGVYCHWDGYPTNRGKQIWEVLVHFFQDVPRHELPSGGEETQAQATIRKFGEVFVDAHPGGWSSFPFVCFCHVEEREENMRRTGKSWREVDLEEWGYVLDYERGCLIIIDHSDLSKLAVLEINKESMDSANHSLAFANDKETREKYSKTQPDWEWIENMEERGRYKGPRRDWRNEEDV